MNSFVNIYNSNYLSDLTPYIITGVMAGLTILSGMKYCLSKRGTNPDLQTIKDLSRQILELNPKIGDADAYDFVATHKRSVLDHTTKAGSLSMLAAGLRAHAKGEKYGQSPIEIVKLGQDLIKNRSGQCDHMAASVIAKIVEHIQNGGTWNSDIELVGNGGHAFVIMNRKGHLKDPTTWGRDTVIIDTWLGKLGVHRDFTDQLTAGDDGVISNPRDIQRNADFFGADRLKVTRRFTADELNSLAVLKI